MKDILNKIHPRFYILLSGLIMGLSVIFAKVGFLSYLALVPLALVTYQRVKKEEYKIKTAYLDGFIFYMTFDIVAFHWFTYFYPLDFAGIDNASAIGIIVLAWIGLSALQSIFSALVFVVASRVARISLCQRYPVLIAIVFASLFAVNEWTQTFTWAGVPWSRMAISQTEMPVMMQSASLFGSYFLTFVIVLFNFLLARVILEPDKRKKYALVTVAVIISHAVLGAVLFFIPTFDESREITIASVQGNLPSGESKSDHGITFSIYKDLTAKAAEEGADIVIWPEGVFPVDIHSRIKIREGFYNNIDKAVSDLAKELDVTIILGSYVHSTDKINTSVSAFYSDGTSHINAYAKRRPVPFGEFLPLEELVYAIAPVLAEINMFSSVDAGERSGYFLSDNGENPIRIGTMICFDSIYETLGIDASREGAEIFIVPSNDSWFYDSRALDMHHSQNILRAVEQGKYTVSCGNTGITSVVSDKGEMISSMPIYTRGYVIDRVYASSGRTLYSYIGNLFVYICIAFALSLVGADIYHKKSKKK